EDADGEQRRAAASRAHADRHGGGRGARAAGRQSSQHDGAPGGYGFGSSRFNIGPVHATARTIRTRTASHRGGPASSVQNLRAALSLACCGRFIRPPTARADSARANFPQEEPMKRSLSVRTLASLLAGAGLLAIGCSE